MKWFSQIRWPGAASSTPEAQELRELARQIKALDLPTLAKGTKSRIARDIGFGYHPYRKTFARSWEGAVAVLLVMVLVFAQSAKPGSALYSVKRGTNKVRTVVTQNVPLLDRFDDSPQPDDNRSGKANTKAEDSHQGGSSDGSGSSSGLDNSSKQGSSGSGSTDSGSGSSGSGSTSPSMSGGDSSNGDSVSPNSGKDRTIIESHY